MLWSLLDDGRGGRASWPGTWALTTGGPVSDRAHDPRQPGTESPAASPSATTVLGTPEGRVEVLDGLVRVQDAPVLVRLLRALDAPAGMVHELRLGRFERPVEGWRDRTARVGGARLRLDGGIEEPAADALTLRVRLQVPSDGWVGLTVVVQEAHEPAVRPPAAADLLPALLQAQARSDADVRAARLPAHHPARAADALRVLQALTDGRSGATVAALTTSLPEAVGADRQYDYRYSWVRDSSLAMSTAALLGRTALAGQHLAALEAACAGGVPDHPVGAVRAEDVPDEREVPGIVGWEGSLPVRMGNGAKSQLQYDVLGMALEAVWVLSQQGLPIDGLWPVVGAIADRLADEVVAGDRPPSAGMWELREPAQLVGADIGRWVALDRAVRLTRPWRLRRSWLQARAATRGRVLGALQPDGGLPQVYGDGADGGSGAYDSDATALLVVLFGLLDRDDPRAGRLVDATLQALGAGPLLWHYPPGGDDGFAGVEGAFLPACWWAVSALALLGRVEEAQERAAALDRLLPPLLPEEWDPARGEGPGNVPLLWSHAECARALYLLDDAVRRRRLGTAGATLWRLGRGVAVRGARRLSRAPERVRSPLQQGRQGCWPVISALSLAGDPGLLALGVTLAPRRSPERRVPYAHEAITTGAHPCLHAAPGAAPTVTGAARPRRG